MSINSETQKKSLLKRIPNYLTFFRTAVIPVILVLYPIGIESLQLFCAFLACLAAMTDWLDGYIARTFSAESKLGALLDPVADKMLTTAALILLVQSGAVWAWLVGILLCREIAISGLRLVALQNNIDLSVTLAAKFKTLALDIAIVCLLVNRPLFNWPFIEVGYICLWISLILSLYTAFIYIRKVLYEAKIIS